MTDASLSSPTPIAERQSVYLAMVRRKRMYGGILMVLFVAILASGFNLADSRNAGGFWNGIGNVFIFPAEVVSEAYEKAANLPPVVILALTGSPRPMIRFSLNN